MPSKSPAVFCALFLSIVTVRAEAAPSPEPVAMTLDVDASELPRKILHARLTIPAKPGTMTLLYPKWIPGEHGPTGPVTNLAGVRISAGGKPIAWRRDDADMYAINCEVPAGATAIYVSLDFLLGGDRKFSSGASSTDKLGVISWNYVLLYPKGRPVREIACRASLRLPAGWKLGTALKATSQDAGRTEFAPVSLETLVDSPVLCGLYLREVALGAAASPGAPTMPPHFLSIACDSEEGLKLSPELKANLDRLVAEAGALFGNRRYSSYRFLLTLSEHVDHFGLEHHASSDNRAAERILIDDDIRKGGWAGLLPHEFVHSWNGKYRRPADMIAPTFHEPVRTRLLWVYEGLTEYLGFVLTARSGIWTDEQMRDAWAGIAETARQQRGRTWRPLDDTAAAAQLLYEAPGAWFRWRRGTDFYNEGALVWLEADTIIRRQTNGARSLDDFVRRFVAAAPDAPLDSVRPYTFDDVVAELNAVAPYDWRGFLTRRVSEPAADPPLEGLSASGWRVTHVPEQSEMQKEYEKSEKVADESASIGVVLKEEGEIEDVVPDGPAHRAGIGPGMKVVAVNGRKLSTEVLRDAVAATGEKEASGKIELLCENDEYFRTFALEYRGGRRYPRLERDEAKPDLLSAILRPLTPVPGATKK
jgi:predicted metalloprotease with PDZ domain